jgi:phage terminase large subunit GpA-like protein
MAKDSGILCPTCANAYKPERDNQEQLEPVGYFIHWEGEPVQCEHCNAMIESAYGTTEDSNV